MSPISKSKLLGQFFSGERIPAFLASLLQLHDIKNVIDPMCGIGDMFLPFINNDIAITGIEIDEFVASQTNSKFPKANILCENAFNPHVINSILQNGGYDLVITNPPFVRREFLNPSASSGFHLDIQTMKYNLLSILKESNHIPNEEKDIFRDTLNNLSLYSDLSSLAWLLCLILLRPGGQLALVIPTSWMTREYAKPIIKLTNSLCQIKYIIIDANRKWFEGSAQVQTSLIIARRNYYGVSFINHTVKIVNIYKEALSSSSLIGNINPVDFKKFIERGQSLLPFFDVNISTQDALTVDTNQNNISLQSKLSPFYDETKDQLISIVDLKINVGQGLRSGANNFFYLKRKGNNCISSLFEQELPFIDSIFFPLIKSQSSLDSKFVLNKYPDDLVLYIQDNALSRDIECSGSHFYYKPLDSRIENYILLCETKEQKGKLIPELSAVKTNISEGKSGKPPRFWYMLPSACKRHFACLFIPRVNSSAPVCRINTLKGKIFLDANFTNLWLDEECVLSPYAVLALLNSTWVKIQFEENGTIMGGGALKLDAVQIKKTLFPIKILEFKETLHELGISLSNDNENSDSIRKQIDKLILKALNIHNEEALNLLYSILNQYQKCRI